MKDTLTPRQRSVLATGMSEALAFRMMVALDNDGERPTLVQMEKKLGEIRKLAARLMEVDSMHRAIVDRYVDAIAEGLLNGLAPSKSPPRSRSKARARGRR